MPEHVGSTMLSMNKVIFISNRIGDGWGRVPVDVSGEDHIHGKKDIY